MRKYLILLIICFSALDSLSALATAFQHPELGFRFDYDEAGWELVGRAPKATAEVDRKMSDKTVVTVQRRLSDAKYHSRFSVVLDEAKPFEKPGKSLLESYRDHAVEFLKSQRFNIQSSSEVKLPGLKTQAFEVVGNQRDFGLTFRQVIFLKDKTAWLLTSATRTDQVEKQAPEVQKIFDSFRWEEKK